MVRVSRRAAPTHYASIRDNKCRLPQSQLASIPTQAITPRPQGRGYIPARFLLPPKLMLAQHAAWSPAHKEQGTQPAMSEQLPFPFNNFTCCFTLFSKCFSSFHHCTCSLSVSRLYLALDGVYHPLGAAFPNNSTPRAPSHTDATDHRLTGLSPSPASPSREPRQRRTSGTALYTLQLGYQR